MPHSEKLKLLIWKNYMLQKRHKWRTFFEISAPVICSLFLVLLRCLVDPKYRPATQYRAFNPYYIEPTPTKLTYLSGRMSLNLDNAVAYSPDNEITKKVVETAMMLMAAGNVNSNATAERIIARAKPPVPFKNAAAMDKVLMEFRSLDTYLAGIQFDDKLASATSWPDKVVITLRYPAVMRYPIIEHPLQLSWKTNLLFPLFVSTGPRDPEDSFGGKLPGYSQESFLSLQHALSMSLIQHKTGTTVNTKVFMKRYPQHPYRDDLLSEILARFISLIIMVCFAYTVSNTVRAVTNEKELQLKETMMVMGLPSWLHWLAWFIKQFSFLFFALVMVVFCLKLPIAHTPDGKWFSVITYTSWSVLLFLLCVYMMTSLAFAFMVSAFFKSANTAASFTGLAWFATYSVYLLTQMMAENMSLTAKMILSLVSNAGMGFLLQMLVTADGSATGISWSDMCTPVTYQDKFTPGHVVVMLIFDTVLYMMIAMYVEKIKPGTYGVPLPWNFPFKKEFWVPTKERKADDLKERTTEEYNESLKSIVHDLEPKDLPIGVDAQNLTKKFGNKIAVDNLNIRMYEDEITVLLGHNGAGKTTIISMFTGSLVPTSGRALVGGYDIVKETNMARNSLGICPQHNVLFPDLTVAEHIIFFASLKDIPKEEINREVDYFVKLLDLEEKRDMVSKKLSGGQKRRLSVGTAMCGSSKVVLLDEPSSGLDPAARRQLWDLLLREKHGRTMIITTHFMDEADVLADRIAIVCGGQLKCYGTSYYLKKNYGVGYKLIIVKDTGCDSDEIAKFILKYVPEAKPNTDVGTELSYILPKESVEKFPELLKNLDASKGTLHISDYGLNVTTLEEVFMKVGAEEEATSDSERSSNPDSLTRGPTISEQALRLKKVTGWQLRINHCRAMFLKLFFNTIRSKVMVFIQIFSPILHIVISVLISRSWGYMASLPPLPLELETGFKSSQTLMSQTAGLKDAKFENEVMKAYRKKFAAVHLPLVDIGAANISKYYLNLAKKEMKRVRQETLIGATFSPQQIIAWFSNYCYHDVAISLAAVDDAILKSVDPKASLRIINYPYPYNIERMLDILAASTNVGFQFAFDITFCLSFITSFLVIFAIKERTSGSKLLQQLSSVRPYMMWTCSFIWDFLWLLVICMFIVITLWFFGEPTLSTSSELGRVFLVFMLMSYVTVPMHYLFSFLFNSAASGFAKMTFINIISGCFAFLIFEILKIPEIGSPYHAKIFDRIFSFMPLYCTCRCLRDLSRSGYALIACDAICKKHPEIKNCDIHYTCKVMDIYVCCVKPYPFYDWEEPGIARYCVTMAFTGTFCYFLLLLKEYQVIQNTMEKWKQKFRKQYGYSYPDLPKNLDEDVLKERALVESLSKDELKKYSLVTKDLTKYYKNLLSVNRLSITVAKGTCFGLLGVNGAGKTTTFKMLTGDQSMSCGNAWVHGYSVRDEIVKVHELIGYCPQFEALIENLSAREILRIFCLLRGIDMKVGNQMALELVRDLGFERHYDKMVYQCSGGTKRKLSTAVALLGFARLIFLDEPTTGVDPASKRLVWKSISEAAKTGRSLVLSSHSMEECEALCSKLTVMIRGTIMCLGSLQHLKNRYSQGYTLIVKCFMNENLDKTVQDVTNYIIQNFNNASHIESHLGISTYYINDSSYQWWQIFQIMQKAKADFGVEDYSVTQTTLEQVFMQFTRHEETDSSESARSTTDTSTSTTTKTPTSTSTKTPTTTSTTTSGSK